MEDMEMKRKGLSMLLAGVMTAGLLAGCGGTSTQKTAEAQTAADGSMELTMWVHETDSSNEGKLYARLADEFNKKYAGKYHVTLSQIARSGDAGGYDDKINAAISNGGLPDVYTVDGVTVAQYADAGAIIPIDEYFTKEELSDFNPSIIQQGTYNGKLYTLGAMDSSVGIYYNKDMFEAAGITPATAKNPWTLDELTEAAKKLTTDDCYGITMSLDAKDETIIYFFLPLIQSQGSNIVSDDGLITDGYMNGKAAVNVLSWIKDMADNGYASATPAENSFELGQAAMALTGAWEPANLAKFPDVSWGLMPMAKYGSSSKAVSACGSWTFAVSGQCADEKKEGAAELVRFMTSTEAAVGMFEANSMPPSRQSAFSQIKEFNEEPLSVFNYQLSNTAQARPVSINYAVASDQFATAVQNVLTGMEVKEALDQAVTQYNFQTDTE